MNTEERIDALHRKYVLKEGVAIDSALLYLAIKKGYGLQELPPADFLAIRYIIEKYLQGRKLL